MRMYEQDNMLYFMREGEIARLSACEANAIRFQSTPNADIIEQNFTLMPKKLPAQIEITEDCGIIQNGDIKAKVYHNGRVEYYIRNKRILREQSEMTFDARIRNYRNKESGLWRARVTFDANENEKFYGMGHEPTDCFDLKGCTVDIRNVNTKTTIPYVYSSLGYGFLWNLPSTGVCELANNRTRWTSDSTRQIDYVVIGGNPRETSETLADLTGHAPEMPEWALGFWQSKLRYETQEQLLEVARKYKELNIPLSVIVADYFHWTEQGDYKFDPKYWRNPKEMADELHNMGVKLVASMWPTINEKSENYREMLENNMLVQTKSGSNRVFDFYGPQAEIDPTNPRTREFVWDKLKQNYIDNGVDEMWFDEAEPEIHPEHFDNLILSIGNADEVGLLYPYYYAKLVYDGMKSIGRRDIITLTRSAYTGAQKFGALVWSGDIPSTFESLRMQIKSGLNMSMCGIPWWTTDIGGFYGADIHSDYFRELIVRWFQYGVFCPVMRVHGDRGEKDRTRGMIEPTGAGNEIWSFGEKNFEILRDLVLLRERLRPYIKKHMDIASEKGYPVMRPMFFDYSDDEVCYTLGEQYMFGDDIIFAPVTEQGATEKTVYLPKGKWILTKDKSEYEGNNRYTVPIRINEFIAFVKKDSDVLKVF